MYDHVSAHMKSVMSDSWEITLRNGLKHPCSLNNICSTYVKACRLLGMPCVSVSPVYHTYKEGQMSWACFFIQYTYSLLLPKTHTHWKMSHNSVGKASVRVFPRKLFSRHHELPSFWRMSSCDQLRTATLIRYMQLAVWNSASVFFPPEC